MSATDDYAFAPRVQQSPADDMHGVAEAATSAAQC
jgi:hypothetical protein